MAILFSDEILASVRKELQNATSSVQVITAYCKEMSLKYLNSCIDPKIKSKRLLLRFRMDDILKGSTDFSVLENGMEMGWDIYIRFDIHAKTYIVDNKRGVVGSANATNAGLHIGNSGNLEMAVFSDVEPRDIEKINRLFNDAIHVDSDIVEKMKKQLNKVKFLEGEDKHKWNTEITKLFQPHIDTLFSYELPEEFSFNKGEYFSFMDETFSGDTDKLKETFRWSNAYLWLLTTLRENEGCLYFGALAERLHNSLVSDPKPFRRDVKVMLANLLTLIEELNMEEIVIDRPNYSQRIQLKQNL